MKSTTQLPQGYGEILSLDLQKNKKLMLLVNGLALLIGALMLLPLIWVEDKGLIAAVFQPRRWLIVCAGMLAYMVLHEMVHGVFICRYSRRKPKFGFTGLYAYAGSDAYFCRKDYIVIGLSPIVIWGIVLAVIQILVPPDWAFAVYIIQIVNISGAAGDLYVTWKMMKLPADILVRDSGVAMCVYSREGRKE